VRIFLYSLFTTKLQNENAAKWTAMKYNKQILNRHQPYNKNQIEENTEETVNGLLRA